MHALLDRRCPTTHAVVPPRRGNWRACVAHSGRCFWTTPAAELQVHNKARHGLLPLCIAQCVACSDFRPRCRRRQTPPPPLCTSGHACAQSRGHVKNCAPTLAGSCNSMCNIKVQTLPRRRHRKASAGKQCTDGKAMLMIKIGSKAGGRRNQSALKAGNHSFVGGCGWE